MGNNGINRPAQEQTDSRGEHIKQQEIIIGQVTYELRQVFQGTRSISDLMAERLPQNIPAIQSVDGGDGHGV